MKARMKQCLHNEIPHDNIWTSDRFRKSFPPLSDLLAVSAVGGSTLRSSSPVWRSWGSPGPASLAVLPAHSPTPPWLHRGRGKGQGGRAWVQCISREGKGQAEKSKQTPGVCQGGSFLLCFPCVLLSFSVTVCQYQSAILSQSLPLLLFWLLLD